MSLEKILERANNNNNNNEHNISIETHVLLNIL